MKGLVMKSTGSWYDVLGEDGNKYACRVRGKIRLDDIRESNPVAVGDHVNFEMIDKAIVQILPRENHMLRQSVKKTGHSHVLAANLSQAMLMATLARPRTSLGFIDRFLVAAESFRIPQVLVFNKKDLLRPHELDELTEVVKIYSDIGVRCFLLSTLYDDLSSLKSILQHKITLLAGHSGVGKSTLLNKLIPGIKLRVSEISNFSEKGTHTTTFAEMFQVDDDSFIIDTPGVKEWGLVDMGPEEISDYFPEMRDRRLNCKFGARCIHLQEPKCAVLDAVRSGEIALSRYENYVSMVLGEDNRK
ncbi:MAG TPA: ribosome small subunit-dependent GTPase A [Cyclobacteriaceae bacterium]|nr:ribosome small subunit-dependent GTPase A [Cyclobacteriaceae bacterium]